MEKIDEKDKKIGIIIFIAGIILTFGTLALVPSENKFAAILAVLGAIISTVGLYFMTKKFDGTKRFLCGFGFLAIFIMLIIVIDFADIQSNNHPPRFAIEIETVSDMIIYKTPFYKVYRINPDTQNEYYIVDQKGEYTKDTIPTSVFNRAKSGIDKIINYRDLYVGDNTNDGNLIAHLPLSEYGYTFEIDSKNFGLTINYKTDTSKIDELYLKKSILYNAVSTFALIQNVQYMKFNFGETNFSVERQKIEEVYPSYEEIVNKDKVINKDNFNKYVEDMMKDDEFVKNIFSKIFE